MPAADATLATLEVTPTTAGASALDLTPAFAANTLSAGPHRATAPFSDTSITVAATATGAANGATVEISPATSPIALMAGAETEITVTVTAEDRITTAEYKVIVYRLNSTPEKDATLSALSLSDGMLDPAFMSDRMEYTARVGNDVGKVTVSFMPTDDAGGVMVNVSSGAEADSVGAGDGCADDAGDDVNLTAGSNTVISLCVTPEAGAGTDNANLKVYAITVYRENENPNTDADLGAFEIKDANPVNGVTPAADATTGLADACGPDTARVLCDLDANSMPIVNYVVRTVSIVATASDATGGAVVEIVSPADKNPSTARHDIDLAPGAVTEIEVMVTAEDTSVTKTYMASVYRRALSPSKDAKLSSLMLSGAPLMYMDDDDMEMTGFMSDVMSYTADAGMRRVTVSAMANHIAAQRGIDITPADADPNMDGHQVDIGDTVDAETTVTVQVRPESVHAATIQTGTNTCADTTPHTDIECYTVTVTRVAEQALRDEAALRAMYDTNGTDGIQIDEAVRAVQDYAAGTLRIEEVVIVVGLYATGG